MRTRELFTIAILAVAAISLAGCAPERGPDEVPSGPPSSSAPSPSSSSSEEPDAGPTTEPPTPVTQSCDELVSAQAMYDYNSNFSLVSQDKADYAGVGCNWVNGTSSETIRLTVARPGASDREALKSAAATKGSPAPGLGGSSYFATSGGVGTATIFEGDYVVVISSTYFLGPDDIQPLADAARSGLGL